MLHRGTQDPRASSVSSVLLTTRFFAGCADLSGVPLWLPPSRRCVSVVNPLSVQHGGNGAKGGTRRRIRKSFVCLRGLGVSLLNHQRIATTNRQILRKLRDPCGVPLWLRLRRAVPPW